MRYVSTLSIHLFKPRLPRIFADNSDKKRMIFHWAIFIGIIILAMGLGTIIPSALEQRFNTYTNCYNPISFDSTNHLVCQSFDTDVQPIAGTITSGLNSYNQFIIGRIIFMLRQPASESFSNPN
jgi:hypothetical protein